MFYLTCTIWLKQWTCTLYVCFDFWTTEGENQTQKKRRERERLREREISKIYEETWMGIEVHEAWYKNRSKGVHTIIKKLKNVLSCYN